MSLYYTRHDGMTQATTTFAPIETAADGSTAGPIAIPPGAKTIKSISAGFAVNGAHTVNTGPVYVLRLTGTGALPDGNQDLVLGSVHHDNGGGTVTDTDTINMAPVRIPCNIAVNPGADLALQGAYYGTDAGSPQISIEVEFEMA